ncbi:MAG: hypothetical protein IT381_26450 [Deltaproteobacteria bacterium]|nr:hypothetical protein [Deltaproteobacteria bacterium]
MTLGTARRLAFALLLSGCTVDTRLDPDTVIACATRGDCPKGFSCSVDLGRCLPDDYLAACGNGISDDGELCDDGNTDSGDGCSSDCRSLERCGNARTDVATGEECDCGDGTELNATCNGPNSLAVGADCRLDCKRPGCGDGVVEVPEQCEANDLGTATCASLGFGGGMLGCSDFCRYDIGGCVGYCGDGIKGDNEACDKGDLGGKDCTHFGFYAAAGLGCSAACTVEVSACSQRCGDGALNGDEDCDGNDLGGRDCTDLGFYDAPGLDCSSACGFDTSACLGACGDRSVNGAEICEGRAPAEESCLDYGFESGALGCLSTCAPDFQRCRRAGFSALPATGAPTSRGAAWSNGPNDVYLGREGGTIWHWDGNAWTKVFDDPLIVELTDIHGTSSSHIVAVGNRANGSTIARYNGSSWSVVHDTTDNSELYGVWSSGPNDTFVVGGLSGNAIALHSTGGVFTPLTMPAPPTTSLHAVWGLASNNVYAVGRNGNILHWDGDDWAPETSGTPLSLWGIWASGPSDVIAVGGEYDGAAGRVVSIILRSTGNGSWAPQAHPAVGPPPAGGDSFLDIWGSGPTDIFAVGGLGSIDYWNGVSWARIDPGSTDHVWSVTGSASDAVFAVNSNDVLRWRGAPWTAMTSNSTRMLTDVWAIAPNDVVAVAQGQFLRFDGTTWTVTTNPGGSAQELNGVWVDSSGEIIVAGNNVVLHYASSTWSTIAGLPRDLKAVWGTAPTDFFVVGVGSPGIWHRTAGAWVPEDPGVAGQNWRDVWGFATDDVFAVGTNGKISHRGTSAWAPMQSNTTEGLYGIWGPAPNDVFAVGLKGTIMHYDGATWTAMPSGTTQTLLEVWGTGPNDVFAIGSRGAEAFGAILHYDGISWSPMRSGVTQEMIGIAGKGDVFVVGSDGVILRRQRSCAANEPLCDDGSDGDCDGLVDCSDPDCVAAPACMAGGLCAGAVTLACNAMTMGTTAGAPNRMDRYACSPTLTVGRERAFRLTPGASGSVTATLTSPGQDLDLIALREGAGGGCEPRLAGCLDASSTAGDESVSFTATAGQDYYVIVDGYGSSAGTFGLSVACP